MTTARREEAIRMLLDFIRRASQKGATPSEVQALPEVARVLLDYLPLRQDD